MLPDPPAERALQLILFAAVRQTLVGKAAIDAILDHHDSSAAIVRLAIERRRG